MTLSIIEAYEKGTGIEVSEETKKIRNNLRDLEQELKTAVNIQDADKYEETTEKIRKIGLGKNIREKFMTLQFLLAIL